MPTTVLVTGAAGFAGSHLLDLLARDGADLVAWRRPPTGTETQASAARMANPRTAARETACPPGVAADGGQPRWEHVDLLDAAAVRAGISRVRPDVVYHCAGAAHVGRAWDHVESTLAANVRGTHHLLDALRRAVAGATRVVIPSSALVYASAGEPLTERHPLVPTSPYGLSKLAQELVGCRAVADGLQVTVARAFNHFGPRQDPFFVASGFARRIADIEAGRWAPEISVGNLDTKRDLTDVRDTVRAYRLILERGTPGRSYNVCSGRAIAIRDLLDRLLARARLPIRVRIDPNRYRPNDVPLLVGDPSRIRDELGWTAEIPLDRTLDDVLEYWRQQA